MMLDDEIEICVRCRFVGPSLDFARTFLDATLPWGMGHGMMG